MTSEVLGACIALGFWGSGKWCDLWCSGYQCDLWSSGYLGFLVCHDLGVPSTDMGSFRVGVFCWSCESRYGAQGRECCWGLFRCLVQAWPTVEQESSAGVVDRDMDSRGESTFGDWGS